MASTTATEKTNHQGASVVKSDAAEIELVAQCLCKAHTFAARIPIPEDGNNAPESTKDPSPLPLEAVYCHCTSCRRSTGGMYSVSVVWPGSLVHDTIDRNSPSLASLKRYKRSKESPATGLFCEICSSLMFYELVLPSRENAVTHGVFLGCLRAYELDSAGNRIGPVTGEKYPLIKPKDHLFVGDTIDGGAGCWIRGWGREDVKLWAGHRGVSQEFVIPEGEGCRQAQHEDVKERDEAQEEAAQAKLQGIKEQEIDTSQAEGGEQTPEYVHIRCHCEGVNLILQTGQSRRDYLDRIRQKQEIPWFVSPHNGKLTGSIDGCDSCTTWAGSDLFYWTFAELKYLSYASDSGSPLPKEKQPVFPHNTIELKAAVEENMSRPQTISPLTLTDPRNAKDHPLGTLSLYKSSPDVQRYFCCRCSASIFYAWDDRPEMVDVSMGVICSPDGKAGAESVISWRLNGKVGWRDDILASGSSRGWARELVLAVEKASRKEVKQNE